MDELWSAAALLIVAAAAASTLARLVVAKQAASAKPIGRSLGLRQARCAAGFTEIPSMVTHSKAVQLLV
jgi:hypothetical protein